MKGEISIDGRKFDNTISNGGVVTLATGFLLAHHIAPFFNHTAFWKLTTRQRTKLLRYSWIPR